MYRVPGSATLESRRGIILLVVLFLLTLFAIAGISFVLYADAEANAARLHRDAGSLTVPDMDPELAFSYFLGQLIYDVWDDETGVYSALRGHSLARSMYGLNSTVNVTTGAFTAASNLAPYIGTGRLHYPSVFANAPGAPPEAQDDYNLINYTFFPLDRFLRDPERLGWRDDLRAPTAQDNRGRYTGGFNAPYTYPDLSNMFLAHVQTSDGRVMLPSFHRGDWTGFGPLAPSNPHWTDPNPLWKYLVLRPRPVDQLLPGESWPPNRPHFPAPDEAGGDVKNLVTAPGGNDSIWIDIGAPVMVLPGGRKFKMLVAPLIIDLDGRVNLNAHGNIMGPGQTHASNQGWGPWEINLGKVLTLGGGGEWRNLFLGNPPTPPPPPPALPMTSQVWGRYGRNQVPVNPGSVVSVSGSTPPHFYSQVDYNAAREGAAGPDQILLPGLGGVPPLSCFPGFPPGRYNNGLNPGTLGAPERTNHASRYNPFRGPGYVATDDDRSFAASNMAALFQVNDQGSEAITSELLRLCPQNLSVDPTVNPAEAALRDRIRRLVTTHSLDRNQPGVIPYVYNTEIDPDNNLNKYPVKVPGWQSQPPIGSSLPFPELAWRDPAQLPPGWVFPPRPPATVATQPTGEFGLNDWRVATADINRVDLNSTRTAYPYLTAARVLALTVTGFPVSYATRWDVMMLPAINPTNGGGVLPDSSLYSSFRSPGGATRSTYRDPPVNGPWTYRLTVGGALSNRQSFADSIYRRLLRVTGVPPCQAPFRPSDEELVPRRWLAQLAVNIVDYLDEDDICTPFNFYTNADANYPNARRESGTIIDPPFDIGELSPRDPNDPDRRDPELPRYWVFGTELPRVVLNEALVEHHPPAAAAAGATYPVNVWVELHNTMRVPTSATVDPDTGFPIPLYYPEIQQPFVSEPEQHGQLMTPNASKGYAPYKVVVADRLLPRPNNDNVLGAPDVERCATRDQDFMMPVNRIDGQPQMTQQIQVQPGTVPPPPPVKLPSPYIEPQGRTDGSNFFVIGPGEDARGTIKAQSQRGRMPDATPFLKTESLQYKVEYNPAVEPVPDDRARGVTVLLRRLVNPNLPYNPQPTIKRPRTSATVVADFIDRNPYYNPYVTIDYLEANPLQNATDPNAVYASRGKRQPYAAFFKAQPGNSLLAAADSPVVDQELTVPPDPPDPLPNTRHSFGQPNTPLPQSGRYDWLVHLDRNLSGPMELLHVSGYPPHQLTQRFITGDNTVRAQKFQHYVPWFDQDLLGAGTSHRLYRFFEFVHARDRATGVTEAKTPGKININAVWDPEVLQALCDAAAVPNDPNHPNYFDATQVLAIFQQMMALRSPGGVPGPNDQPFLSVGIGQSPPGLQYPGGLPGVERTVLRSFDGTRAADGTVRRLFEPVIAPPNDHPYFQYQLLTKIFENMTTRSNVFAVWATVGFFEVIDDTSRPVKLGAEIGRAEGRNLRHRMFAIIDRSQIATNSGPTASLQRFNPHSNTTVVLYFAIIK